MHEQLTIDFTDRIENSFESNAILQANKEHINNQCDIVYGALLSGEQLTVRSAMIKYGIGDLRRRIKDLRDFRGIDIKTKLLEGRFKIYFL